MKSSPKTPTSRKAYLGLDIHSATTVLVVLNQTGQRLSTRRFGTTGHNLIEAVKAVRATDKHVVLEETPMSHWAVELLRPHCQRVVSCGAKQNRWIARNPQKNDETDAERLAELLRLGRLKEVFHTRDTDRFAFKGAVQHYLDVQQDRIRAKNKIKALFKRVGLPSITGPGVFNQKQRKVILELVPPGAWRLALERRYRHYDHLHAEAREALKEVEQLGRSYWEVAEFLKIPGVGPVTAHSVSAFLQTPHRFKDKSALYRYAALSITDRSSDNKPLGFQRLERGHGCVELKRASYHAWLAATAARNDNEVKTWFLRHLESNGYQQKRSRLATQRKLLATMWALWLHRTTYDPERFAYHRSQSKA